MRVVVAGASGAIGLPIVRCLSDAGHQVTGLTRSGDGAERIRHAGGVPVAANVLDTTGLDDAVLAARPDVVVEQLTALPRTDTPEAMRASLAATTRVRVEGGRNLQAAAVRAGATHYLAQSGCYYYAPGDGPATESEPLTGSGAPLVRGNVAAFRAVEDRVLGELDLNGAVLRYGFFYGPGTWYSSDGDMAQQARAGALAVSGDGTAVWSFVHVEDAAAVTAIAAVESSLTGAVNITDDQPLPLNVWLPSFVRHVGGAPAAAVPLGADADGDAVFYATEMRGASDQRARRELGFQPRPLEWL